MSTLNVYDKQNHIIRKQGIHVVLINKWIQPVMLSKNTVLTGIYFSCINLSVSTDSLSLKVLVSKEFASDSRSMWFFYKYFGSLNY